MSFFFSCWNPIIFFLSNRENNQMVLLKMHKDYLDASPTWKSKLETHAGRLNVKHEDVKQTNTAISIRKSNLLILFRNCIFTQQILILSLVHWVTRNMFLFMRHHLLKRWLHVMIKLKVVLVRFCKYLFLYDVHMSSFFTWIYRKDRHVFFSLFFFCSKAKNRQAHTHS